MNPHDEGGYNSLDLPRHGSVPKWLRDITQSVTSSQEAISKMYTFGGPAKILEPNSVPDAIPTETAVKLSSQAAKYGRRASLVSGFQATLTPKHVKISPEQYLVPNLENFNYNLDFQQDALERSWKGLNVFQKSHKGRLDSATNYNTSPNLSLSDQVPPISSEKLSSESESSSYSPSILQENPRNRSQSEMSNYLPMYVYANIKQVTETNASNPKSKSTEDIRRSASKESIGGKQKKVESKHPISDYRLRVAEEEELRRKIINELLTENERIIQQVGQTRRRHSQPKSPSFDDLATFQQMKKQRRSRKEERRSMDFIIPTLPKGRLLIVNILTTWGDKHYLGLNGIDIFGDDGKIINVKKISATPADVNVLPEYNNDPRVITNLLDGVNRTQDDVHLWLTPFISGRNHTISIEFENAATLAMLRIWNYNKSRIHSFRGAKDVEISLDGTLIFIGEIRKACGGIRGGVDAFGDIILFTVDEEILDKIAENDVFYPTLMCSSYEEVNNLDRPPTSAFKQNMIQRPLTGPSGSSSEEEILFGAFELKLLLLENWGHNSLVGLTGLDLIQGGDNVIEIRQDMMKCNGNCSDLSTLTNGSNLTTNENDMWIARFEREILISIKFDNFTYMSGIRIWNYNQSLDKVSIGVSKMKIFLDNKPIKSVNGLEGGIFWVRRAPGNVYYDFVQEINFDDKAGRNESYNVKMIPSLREKPNALEFYEYPDIPTGFVIQINIFSTWGDRYYCGLNGLEVYDQFGKMIGLEESNVCAYPESINVLADVSNDVRTPDKLIDECNDDNNGAHSWLAPILPKCLNRIYVVFDHPVKVSLIKLWNYSKTPKRGVKEFAVLVDDLLVYNGILDEYSHQNLRNYRSIVFTSNEEVINSEKPTAVKQSGSGGVLLLNHDPRTTSGGSLPDADPALRPFTSVSPFNRGYTPRSQ